MYAIDLSPDGDAIRIQPGRNAESRDSNARGDGTWVQFDLPRYTTTADAGLKWVGVRTDADGWTIAPDEKSRFVWYAKRAKPGGGAELIRLGLDPDLDQAPTCYTFVPTAAGKPPRVLVGHYYGCSLFELDPARVTQNVHTGIKELPRSKLFVGHGGEVTSVVADARGEWFVTASVDQTVAGWSLADWKAQSVLGAAFQVQAGKLVVTATDVGSPAWEAGLTPGDVIDRLAVDGKLVYDGREKQNPAEVAAAAAALKNPQPGVELFFNWAAGKERRATPSRIKQRPMWKWFPSFDDRGRLTDSVIWMWHGSYYYTASLHGDRMVGWHVNHPDVAGTATFQPLERYKHLFLKPAAISKLIGTRSIEAALKEAVGDNPLRQSFRDREPPEIRLALQQAEVRGDGVAVSVSVNPLGNNPDLIPDRVELWLNDYRYEVWKGQGARALELTIPAAKFRAGTNQITLLATNPARGRAEETRFVHNPAAAARTDVHGLSVGINDYSAHKKAAIAARANAFENLVTPHADATGVADAFHSYRGKGKHFAAGEVDVALDAKADRKSLTASLAALKAKQAAGQIKPDDLLVVFLAGHGDLLTTDGKERLNARAAGRGLAADVGRFVFCCPNYAFANPAGTSLSGEELFEELAGINCRKLVLLDACHAGGAVEANLLRRCIPNGQGPIVFASCDQSELSFEDDKKLGHGAFTYALLEALSPDKKFRAADRNSDGSLMPDELFTYLADRVPEVVKQLRPGNTQNPICFPHPTALPRVAIVKQ
jgi:hypothetical protein